MRDFQRHLKLLPHGDRLLTSSAAFWFFSARVIVFAMAASESVAWAYLGFLFGDGWTRWTGMVFTGVVIFLVVWIIDVSLVTLDRAWSDHAKTILGHDAISARGRRFREWFTFSLRVALLLMSLTITAPYLAQLVFHKDIERHIASEASAALDAERKQIKSKYDLLIAARAAEIEKKRSEYEREVAGTGLSRRYGRGPAAEAIARTVAKLEGERDALIQEMDSTLRGFDALAVNWVANRDEFAATYNVVLPQPSVLENRKALEALRKLPENQSTELAIKAFLAFIFAGLLLLKLFEPSSVRLYLSEVLQQEYSRYTAGTFDSLLPQSERSTTNPLAMSPQRLHEFLVRVWVPARKLEETQADARARTAIAAQGLDALGQVRRQLTKEVDDAKAAVKDLRKTADDANQSVAELKSAIATIQQDIDCFRAELKSVDARDSKLDERSRLEYRSYITGQLVDAERALRQLEDRRPTVTETYRRAEAALKEVEAKLREKDAELAAADKRIRSLREMLADSAGNRARSILSPST